MITAIVDAARIALLKNKARAHYLSHRRIADQYDCGLALVGYISPELANHAKAFNETMDELAKIDPDTPKGRL